MPGGGKQPGAGRPKGARNKATAEIKDLCAKYTDRAIKRIVDLIDGAEDERVQFQAAQEILNRVYGKPRQEVGVSGDLTINFADRVEAARRRALKGEGK